MIYINVISFVLISWPEKNHGMIETRRLKNFVIFFQKILNFVLSRKIVTHTISSHVVNEVLAILSKYIHWHVSLFQFWFELNFVLLNLHLQSREIFFAIASFLFFIIYNVLTTKSVSFRTHIFGDKTLQISLHFFFFFSSFNETHFVAKEQLKLSNTIKHLFNKAEHYFILFLVIKYLWMFNMSDLSIKL